MNTRRNQCTDRYSESQTDRHDDLRTFGSPRILPAFVAALMLCLCLCAGCGGDSTSPEDTPIATGTIGDDGGELATDDVTLTVPTGSFDADTDLNLYQQSGGNPFSGTEPVYRFSGIPESLDQPLTLRIRHGVVKSLTAADDEDSLMLFLGEERESTDGGRSLSWFRIACRDSAGWCIADLHRGPYLLDAKDAPDLHAAVSSVTRAISVGDGHFEVVFDDSEVTREEAIFIAQTFEHMYDTIYTMGFHFGEQDTIWPLDVYMREPEAETIAEYKAGAWGKGHFNFEPFLAGSEELLARVILHETLHCAQDYYDVRHPSEWKVINQERLWLDEATAAWLECVATDYATCKPFGMNLDNYKAPLAGIVGHPALENAQYGYGMASFMKYLFEHQTEERLHELYVAFSQHGMVVDALMDVLDPPLTEWCVDFQRKLITNELFVYDNLDVFWWDWAIDRRWNANGGPETLSTTVTDFGSRVLKFAIEGGEPDENTSLEVTLTTIDAKNDPALELAVYGRPTDGVPVLLGTGTDNVLVDDWPAVYAANEDILVQIIKPWGEGPEYYTETPATVELDLAEESDLSRFETVQVSAQYHAFWSAGDERPEQGLNFIARDGEWNGNTYTAEWDSLDNGTRFVGSLTATVSADGQSLLSWSAQSWWEYNGDQDYNYYTMSCSGSAPLVYTSDNMMRYELDDEAVCGFATNIYVANVRDGVTTDEVVNYICNDDSYLTFRFRDDE